MYLKRRLNIRKIVQLHAQDCNKDDHVFLSNCTQQPVAKFQYSTQIVKFVSTM